MEELKYEFDTWEEYLDAMNNHLSEYHDCELCRGKIVGIYIDKMGNTHCAYCNAIVKYPKMKREAFEKMLIKEFKDKGITIPKNWKEGEKIEWKN